MSLLIRILFCAVTALVVVGTALWSVGAVVYSYLWSSFVGKAAVVVVSSSAAWGCRRNLCNGMA